MTLGSRFRDRLLVRVEDRERRMPVGAQNSCATEGSRPQSYSDAVGWPAKAATIPPATRGTRRHRFIGILRGLEDDAHVVGKVEAFANELEDARISVLDMCVEGSGVWPQYLHHVRVEVSSVKKSSVAAVSNTTSASSNAASSITIPSRRLAGHHRRSQWPIASRRSESIDPGSTSTPDRSTVRAS